MEGLRLACRFSFITNRLRYCGPIGAFKDFYYCLQGNGFDRELIKEHLKRYEGLFVYLEKIADKLGRDSFDYEVIESYWLGNEHLEKFDGEGLKEMVMALTQRGLPKSYAEALLEKIPQAMVPHHSFNVLFIGVGKITGSVPTTLKMMNKCIVSQGKVVLVEKGVLHVELAPLVIEQGCIAKGKKEIQIVEYHKEFLTGIGPGQNVAVHWDYACKILSNRELRNLECYTQRNMDALNQAGFFSNAQGLL